MYMYMYTLFFLYHIGLYIYTHLYMHIIMMSWVQMQFLKYPTTNLICTCDDHAIGKMLCATLMNKLLQHLVYPYSLELHATCCPVYGRLRSRYEIIQLERGLILPFLNDDALWICYLTYM